MAGLHLAAGLAIKFWFVKGAASGKSMTVTGITTSDTLLGVLAFRTSAIQKSIGAICSVQNVLATSRISAAGKIIVSGTNTSNMLVQVIYSDRTD